MSKIIGIDLGTTNSCVAVLEGGIATVIPNSEGSRTTPSIVAFTSDGERLVGDPAKRQAVTNTARTVSSIKRQMGTNHRMVIDGKKYSAPEISAMILRKLRRDAENYLGETVDRAVITVPAYFDDAQRQATKDAGRIAGLTVERIINEPTAAAVAYGVDTSIGRKIMVFDLGGGTFDVSIIEISEGLIEVIAVAGDNKLGGDDFDGAVAAYLVSEFRREAGIDISHDMMAMQRIREAAEKAKIELSTATSTNINLPFIATDRTGPKHLDIMLTRAKFDELTYSLVERTRGPVELALNDAHLKAGDIDKVLLVGGSTRIPAVQDKVRQLMKQEPGRNINPDECVALGAALQGGKLAGESGLNELLLMDVTPMTLSIETIGGVATHIIAKNSRIPTRFSQIFTTAANFQTSVDVNVLQGERHFAKDNKLLGTFRLTGIKRAMRGVPQIEVTFDIDANGILVVSAKDLGTGNSQQIVISGSSNLSEDEIQKAIEDNKRG